MKPRRSYTIVGRITLLVFAVGLLSLLLHGMLIATAMRPKENRFARSIAFELELARQALAGATPEGQPALTSILAAGGWRLTPLADAPATAALPPGSGPGPTKGRPPRHATPPSLFGLRRPGGGPPPIDPMLADVAALLGDGVRPLGAAGTDGGGPEPSPGAGPGPRHALRFAIDAGGQWWQADLKLPEPPQRDLAWPLVAAFGFVAAAAALAIVLGVRSIARPLSRLSAAMLERQQRLEPIADPVDAGSEVRDVVRAFNQLVRALQAAQVNQRGMLAGLSHDLRTPLARLRLRVELECSEEVLERAIPDFEAFERMIDQFLAFTQGELEAADDGAEHSLRETVSVVVDEYRLVGQPVALAMLAQEDRAFPELALRRILSNLIDNALGHGQAPVEVELGCSGDRLELLVYDRGQGIAEADVETALRPFVRLGSPALGHTGLGLAIVTQIAERYGGRVITRRESGGRFGIGVSLPSGSGSGGVAGPLAHADCSV
ncbi:MAG: HAMP domain-containing protein [Burkholderiales bacterium]|nr:HAMP domain-containing protein [Burkholderiales bacterium]OJX06570.1 MAG: hypothetical protein BGO72_16275 [Burkholderiales bacterium 70-64]